MEEVIINILERPQQSGGVPAPVRRSVLLLLEELVELEEERCSVEERMTNKLYVKIYFVDNKPDLQNKFVFIFVYLLMTTSQYLILFERQTCKPAFCNKFPKFAQVKP